METISADLVERDHLMSAEDEVEAHIESIVEKYAEYVNPGLARLLQFAGFGDLEETAEGCIVTTASGKKYLDFVGGFGVFSLGHRHPRVVEAVHRQLDKMPLSTRTFFNESAALLSERLAQLSPGDLQYTFYSNSGAEAVEAALKFARKATGRTEFLSTEGAYHGKTMGALAVTGREKYRAPFEPMVPGAKFAPFNDLGAMESLISDKTAAIIIEPVQGEGGIHVAAPGYLAGLRKLCDDHGALLIFDEVQSGMGRTGTLFACEQDGVAPDIMTLAKALGGGVMPIGATLYTPAIGAAVFGENPLLHTSTFGGNSLACAAGLAALQVIEDEHLAEKATLRGNQLLAGLRSVMSEMPEALVDVRGRGLMIGVEFAIKDIAELTINYMATHHGIIAAYTLNNPKVIRMEPPLVVTEAQVEEVIEAFRLSVASAVEILADL